MSGDMYLSLSQGLAKKKSKKKIKEKNQRNSRTKKEIKGGTGRKNDSQKCIDFLSGLPDFCSDHFVDLLEWDCGLQWPQELNGLTGGQQLYGNHLGNKGNCI